MLLTLIETSANQAYIFGSNRLRQNVGASDLLFRPCTQYVLDAVGSFLGKPSLWRSDGSERMEALADPERSPRIDRGDPLEVLVATSGRAIILFVGPEPAKTLVREVTRRTLEAAPGLSVCGATVEFDSEKAGSLHDAIGRAMHQVGSARSNLPDPARRFLRLPPVAECRTTGWPAANWARPTSAESEEPQSAVAAAEYRAAEDGYQRARKLLSLIRLPRTIEQMQERFDIDSVGVVHADGNGMGMVFAGLGSRWADNKEYAEGLRAFSLALEQAGERALARAAAAIGSPGGETPVIPLIVGGDDMTALCEGRHAVRLAEAYLEAFEEESGTAGKMVGQPGFTACAGVAVVKPHYPFHAAYELAEELLGRAKAVKRWAAESRVPVPSAFDFHVVQGSSGADLASIRPSSPGGLPAHGPARISADRVCALWGGPYVIGAPSDGGDADLWTARRMRSLRRRAELLQTGRGERSEGLSSSLVHDLRTAVFEGREVADARLRLEIGRQPRLAKLAESGGDADGQSLFRDADAALQAGGYRQQTSFVDVLELAGLEGV